MDDKLINLESWLLRQKQFTKNGIDVAESKDKFEVMKLDTYEFIRQSIERIRMIEVIEQLIPLMGPNQKLSIEKYLRDGK